MQQGGRPGTRFAQFKLVLLGMRLSFLYLNIASKVLIMSTGESAVGKVSSSGFDERNEKLMDQTEFASPPIRKGVS